MGLDLGFAIGFIAAISGLAWVAGRRLSLTVYRNRSLLFAECLIFAIVFAFGFLDRLHWASAFHHPASMCWGNWLPIVLAFCAGLATEMRKLGRASRVIVPASLLILAFGFLLLPVARPVISPIYLSGDDTWSDGVCMQSHSASCGPAATATLLRQTGNLDRARMNIATIEDILASPMNTSGRSSESLMARVCLTSRHGTTPLGLYRGVSLALTGSSKVARVADSDPQNWLAHGQLPNVAVVRFRASPQARRSIRSLGGESEAHAIVVYGRTSVGEWVIADPAVGWTTMGDEELRSRFTGDAIYIASR